MFYAELSKVPSLRSQLSYKHSVSGAKGGTHAEEDSSPRASPRSGCQPGWSAKHRCGASGEGHRCIGLWRWDCWVHFIGSGPSCQITQLVFPAWPDLILKLEAGVPRAMSRTVCHSGDSFSQARCALDTQPCDVDMARLALCFQGRIFYQVWLGFTLKLGRKSQKWDIGEVGNFFILAFLSQWSLLET